MYITDSGPIRLCRVCCRTYGMRDVAERLIQHKVKLSAVLASRPQSKGYKSHLTYMYFSLELESSFGIMDFFHTGASAVYCKYNTSYTSH